MPLYDYQCKSCGKVEERFAKVEEKECICDCGGVMHRLIPRSFGVSIDFVPGYYSCVARFRKDPNAYCSTKKELLDKAARLGVKVMKDPDL
jgi:putative FmdB family regulatory protein